MNTLVQIIPIIIVVVLAVFIIVVYGFFPKMKGLHFTSRLTCPKCGHTFDYPWVPGGSLSLVIRWFNNRYMQCPQCGQWSWFDVMSTRIDDN